MTAETFSIGMLDEEQNIIDTVMIENEKRIPSFTIPFGGEYSACGVVY